MTCKRTRFTTPNQRFHKAALRLRKISIYFSQIFLHQSRQHLKKKGHCNINTQKPIKTSNSRLLLLILPRTKNCKCISRENVKRDYYFGECTSISTGTNARRILESIPRSLYDALEILRDSWKKEG